MTSSNHPLLPWPALPTAIRDTALTVAGLANGEAPLSFDSFRRTCEEQVARLRKEMIDAGHATEIVDDASYSQCALLDEAALRGLRQFDRDAWERHPLQVSQFQSHDAGHELIERMVRRLGEPSPDLGLLAIFAAVLGLGFVGRFALDGEEARYTLMRAIDARLGRRDISGEDEDEVDGGHARVDPNKNASGNSLGNVIVGRQANPLWSRRMPIFGWIAIAFLGACAIYVWLDQWLSASVAQLVS